MRRSAHVFAGSFLQGSIAASLPKARSRHVALLATVSIAALVVPMGAAQAQNTVIEGAPVTVPGTHLSPWILSRNLQVGDSLGGHSGH